MKRQTALFLFLLATAAVNAQSRSSALSIELGKNGLLYNLTYDHKLSNYGLRVVTGHNLARYLRAFVAGGGGYYLAGRGVRFLELGADLYYLRITELSDDQVSFTFIHPSAPASTLYPSANIGYRSYGDRTLFRIGFSPGIIKQEFIPGGYLSIGVLL